MEREQSEFCNLKASQYTKMKLRSQKEMEKLQLLDAYELLMVILKEGYMYSIYCMLNIRTFLKIILCCYYIQYIL